MLSQNQYQLRPQFYNNGIRFKAEKLLIRERCKIIILKQETVKENFKSALVNRINAKDKVCAGRIGDGRKVITAENKEAYFLLNSVQEALVHSGHKETTFYVVDYGWAQEKRNYTK